MGIEVNFEGKIALVTGASSGLGARFAKVLASAGVKDLDRYAVTPGNRDFLPDFFVD